MKTALTIAFIILCVAIIVLISMQEGKSAGLGALTGSSDGYWTKIKSRSKEGKLVRYTTIGIVLFFVVAIVLCLI